MSPNLHTHSQSLTFTSKFFFCSIRFPPHFRFYSILFFLLLLYFVLSYSTHFLRLFGWFRVDATSMRVLYYSCYLLLHFAAIFGHLFYFWIYHILLNRSNAMWHNDRKRQRTKKEFRNKYRKNGNTSFAIKNKILLRLCTLYSARVESNFDEFSFKSKLYFNLFNSWNDNVLMIEWDHGPFIIDSVFLTVQKI